MKNKAFTLIELLIVVAIIAILAAIAVPNFLEAQTRSKVSRTKADQRTLATAIESYAVDYNNPPMIVAPTAPLRGGSAPGSGINGASVFLAGQAGISSRFIALTTPVSYITAVFRDPFIPASVGLAGSCNNPTSTAAGYDTYDYVDSFTLAPDSYIDDQRAAAISSGASWHVVSAGPDGENCFGGGTSAQAFGPGGVDYDPTNGTVSRGDVVRIGSGPGQLVDGGPDPAINRITNQYNFTP